jgi:hypothetical protein
MNLKVLFRKIHRYNFLATNYRLGRPRKKHQPPHALFLLLSPMLEKPSVRTSLVRPFRYKAHFRGWHLEKFSPSYFILWRIGNGVGVYPIFHLHAVENWGDCSPPWN